MSALILSHEGEFQMSDLDIRALETNFENWRRDRAPNLSQDKAFERYAAEQILKDAELSDEEIESGILGGGDDGGIDGVYFFVNRTLIQDETPMPEPAMSAELYLIQAKYEKGFGETAVEKMRDFTRDLLDYSKTVDQFTYLNSSARDAMTRFRAKYDAILGSQHTLTIRFYYVTKSDSSPNTKVATRVQNLKDFVKAQLSAAIVAFNYWGCVQLLDAARDTPQITLKIGYTEYFNTSDKSVVCLVRLKDFAEFLKDPVGALRRSLLEPNVRDYQGKVNPVNRDIRATLKTPNDSSEFWWLNNGVTILATDCHISGDKVVIEHPEIVNGLQTSQEVFSYFAEHPEQEDTRNLLIRVIVPPEEQTRIRIIKATNFQTSVENLSLRASDRLHFDIEERLRLHDLYYDRRKGQYKQQRKPISKIVSIKELARPVIAIVLRRPDDARARPQTLTNKEDTYTQIFNDTFNRDVYVTCILLDRQVSEYLSKQDALDKDERGDIKYYVDMAVACRLAETAKPTPDNIAALAKQCASPIAEEIMNAACQEVITIYRELVVRLSTLGQMGAGDKVAKGTELRTRLIALLEARYPEPERKETRPPA
jgi:hypothetical protein